MNKLIWHLITIPKRSIGQLSDYLFRAQSLANILAIGFLLGMGIVLWWTPNYLEPETFMNIGDSIFPFLPEKFLWDYYFIWFENSKDGLGSAEGYHSGIIMVYYWFLAKFQASGIPLWVINRLFFLIPTWLFLFSGYYFILSFIKGRFSHGVAALGTLFLVTAPPQTYIAPRPTLALAGFVLAFASIQRYLDSRKNFHLFLFGIASVFMTSMPRYAYLTLVFAPIYVLTWSFLNSGTAHALNTKTFAKATGIIIFSTLGLNWYTILPTLNFFLDYSSAELMMSADQYNLRTQEVINFYRDQTQPIFTLRLIVNNIYSLHTAYFSNSFLGFFSFSIPFLMALGILLGIKNKNIMAMGVFFLFATGLSISFGTPFYGWLFQHIPGFWILNNPHYLQSAISLSAAFFLAYVFFETRQYFARKTASVKRIASGWLLHIFFSGLIIAFNGTFFFDWIPKSRRIFVSGDMTSRGMGNHLPFFKIPNEYYNIKNLVDEDPNTRILIFPFLMNGYMRYSWYKNTTMPEILCSIIPLRAGGISADQTRVIKKIKDYIWDGETDKLVAALSKYSYKFIFIHKDRLPSSDYKFKEEFLRTNRFFKNLKQAELIADNDYYSLYKLVTNHQNA